MTVVQQVEKNAAPEPEWLLVTRDYIIHRTQLSVLYHRKRERFYAWFCRVVDQTAEFPPTRPSPLRLNGPFLPA
jgi:hypothetical protein